MPTSSAYDRTPRLVSGVDPRALALDATDAFVLSCIDGASREAEIALITGIDRDTVSAILTRLFELGVITLGTDLPPALNRARPMTTSSSGSYRIGPIRELYEAPSSHPDLREEREAPEGPTSSRQPTAPLAAPATEQVELDPTLQQRILDKFAELPHSNHYQLLGVQAHADPKVIRHAYFEFATAFHPDRHFRKELGSFKLKLEKVFTRVTEAYSVLNRAQSRAQYDRYLQLSDRTRELDNSLERVAEPGRASEPAVQRPSSAPGPDSAARRHALARKLGHSVPSARCSEPSVGAPASSEPPPSSQQWATRELERRYQERVKAQDSQLERYLGQVEVSLKRNDWVAATNALRLACATRPDDAALAARLAELEQKAVSSLWQEYLERARYEEEEGQFLLAAYSYERAAAGHADARLFERAAACFLVDARELRRAMDHARKAVQMAPDNVKCRVTLARCLLRANMRESALNELVRAHELAPKDRSIKELIRQAERGDD